MVGAAGMVGCVQQAEVVVGVWGEGSEAQPAKAQRSQHSHCVPDANTCGIQRDRLVNVPRGGGGYLCACAGHGVPCSQRVQADTIVLNVACTFLLTGIVPPLALLAARNSACRHTNMQVNADGRAAGSWWWWVGGATVPARQLGACGCGWGLEPLRRLREGERASGEVCVCGVA